MAGALVIGLPLLCDRACGWPAGASPSRGEFERLVQRTERLADQGLAAEPDETDFMALDPHDDGEFEELVRDALDELPVWARARWSATWRW